MVNRGEMMSVEDVAEILYSYAYHNIPLKKNEIMVG